MEVVNSFRFSGICFNNDGGSQDDVKIWLDEGLKTFDTIRMRQKCSCVRVVVSLKKHEADG